MTLVVLPETGQRTIVTALEAVGSPSRQKQRTPGVWQVANRHITLSILINNNTENTQNKMTFEPSPEKIGLHLIVKRLPINISHQTWREKQVLVYVKI